MRQERIQSHWTHLTGAVLLGSAAMLMSGCNQGLTEQDVADSRDAVQEEQRETAEARQQADEAVREEQHETASVRREANKPILGKDVREERQETREARREGNEAVREEQQETAEAQADLNETEAKLEAQKARDQYVSEVEGTIQKADKRLKELRQDGAELEDFAKEKNDKQIAQLEAKRDKVNDALDDLKSAELQNWDKSRDEVETAKDDLTQEIAASR